ncbi:MAG TPA: hypothetical protein VEP50_01090 [bacterium]|nr:hypothetical protein [bacterium]
MSRARKILLEALCHVTLLRDVPRGRLGVPGGNDAISLLCGQSRDVSMVGCLTQTGPDRHM